MSQVLIIKGEFLEGGDLKILARVTNHNRTVLQTSMLTTGNATVNLYDLSGATPQTAIATNTSLTATALIENTLLTSSSGWSQDTIGANFQFVLSTATPSGAFSGKGIAWPSGHPIGGHRYRLEIQLPTTDFGNIPIVAEMLCRPVYSS